MTFNEEQLKTLSAFEEHFHTAVFKKWSRNPGRTALKVIYDIFTSTTGDRRRYNDNCSNCILDLLTDCGKIYFKDKEELLARKNDAKAVEATLEDAKPVKKVAVKTKTKKNK